MVTSPNSEFDKLAQDVSQIKQAVSMITRRLDTLDQAIIKLFHTHQINEKRFDTRVFRALAEGLNIASHDLSHRLEHMDGQHHVDPTLRVDIVDGENVKENEYSAIVTRRDDGGYNFAYVNDPQTFINEGSEGLVEYFNANPELMTDKDTLVINIYSVGVSEDGKEG